MVGDSEFEVHIGRSIRWSGEKSVHHELKALHTMTLWIKAIFVVCVDVVCIFLCERAKYFSSPWRIEIAAKDEFSQRIKRAHEFLYIATLVIVCLSIGSPSEVRGCYTKRNIVFFYIAHQKREVFVIPRIRIALIQFWKVRGVEMSLRATLMRPSAPWPL